MSEEKVKNKNLKDSIFITLMTLKTDHSTVLFELKIQNIKISFFDTDV